MPLVRRDVRLSPSLSPIKRSFEQHQDPERWNWKYLVKRCGHIMYHAYKTFVWNFESKSFVERGWISMSISDYDRYLALRSKVLGRTTTTTTSNETDGALVNTKIEKISREQSIRGYRTKFRCGNKVVQSCVRGW